MQRRPWPLVILAIFQIFSPLGSIAASAYVNQVGFGEMAAAIWKYSPVVDLLTFYGLPFLQGTFIFFAKRFGYFLVLALAALSIYLNIQEWKIASDVISVPMLILVTSTNAALLVYLLLPSVRAVFMNPRLRWWETPPRYTVNLRAQISKDDGQAKPCTIVDLSTGGAGLQTETEIFKNGETALITFEHAGNTILMRSTVVYGRPDGNGHRYGVEWQRGAEADERRTMAYLAELSERDAPVSRPPPKWREDLQNWWTRAKKSPSAWVPELPKKK